MTTTQIGSKILPAHQVGDGAGTAQDQPKPGRISSIHHVNDGVEYVVRTDPSTAALAGPQHLTSWHLVVPDDPGRCVMTLSTHDERLSWTQLGVHMGYTAQEPQREEILDAIACMTWTETPARPPYLDGPAVRAILNAVFHHRRDQLHLVGVARLNGGRQLIGLEDTIGTRSYLLDLDAEAIYVLAEFSHPLTRHQRNRVA